MSEFWQYVRTHEWLKKELRSHWTFLLFWLGVAAAASPFSVMFAAFMGIIALLWLGVAIDKHREAKQAWHTWVIIWARSFTDEADGEARMKQALGVK